ncbi:MAG: flippase-like domain-containing protein [Deltaproteobacteria bacterium]|nr:flippase-like domain-containing protein [Deltaproteobacteria bacterium]
MRRVNLILLAIAVVFFVWILNEVGWDKLGQHLRQVGWYWPVLLLPYGLVTLLEAVSWKYIIINLPPQTSLFRLFWLRLGGEALNQLTPTASLGGEPFKAARLQADGLSLDQATASVVIHKGILVLSLVLYIILGLALAPLYLPAARAYLAALSLGALGLAVAGGIFVLVQRQGSFCSNALRFLDRRGWCPRFLKDKEGFFADLDDSLSSFYREYPGRAALSFSLFFLSWLLHAVEVYLMFWLMGHPISWGLALCLDSLAMLFTAMGFFIPAAAGVQEGGNLLLSLGFNLGLTLGATFSILRRLREAFWLSLGLLVVWREK